MVKKKKTKKSIKTKKPSAPKRAAKKDTGYIIPVAALLLAIIAGIILALTAGSSYSRDSISISESFYDRLLNPVQTQMSGDVAIRQPKITISPGDYGTVDFELYIMSQCPYGTLFENAFAPVLEKVGDSVNFKLEFIGRGDADNLQSLHGQPEVDENIVQICVDKHYPDKLMSYIICRNKNIKDANWKPCATQNGIDVNTIQACFDGEGKQLMAESFQRSQEAGAQGSPTAKINGNLYQGARDTASLMRAVCANLNNHPECADLPACGNDMECVAQPDKVGRCVNPNTNNAKCEYDDPLPIEIVIVNDEKCSDCDTAQIKEVTKQLFKGATFKEVDVSTSEGKGLIESYELMFAPAYIFKGDLENTYMWEANPQIRGAFTKIGNDYMLKPEATGSSWFINEEARKDYYSAIGVTLDDNKPQLDFFVMSYCPYGNKAEELVADVYDVLGDNAEFNPHYVIYSNYRGGGHNYCFDDENVYCSMHGIQELNQDIREQCVNKYLGIAKYFEFVKEMNSKCTSQNADTCWEGVAQGLGIDLSMVKTCFDDEALDFLETDKELNTVLGVTGSPTIFIEGEKYAGPRSAAGYMAALCAKFDTAPSECGTQIAETAGSSVPAGNCG